MSKGYMPGSMDLLLDTMCNTFGGVVFIAISLSLIFVVNRTQTSPAEDIAKIKQTLKQQQQEFLNLENKKNSLTKKLLSVKEFSSQFSQTKSFLPETVTKLEQDCKDLQREIEIKKIQKKELNSKNIRIKKENKQIELKNQEKIEKTTRDNEKLKKEYQKLCFIFDELQEKLRKTPTKRIHFAHNEQTSKLPYILILKNNQLFRLGTDYHHSSRDVRVKTERKLLHLTLVDGHLLSAISTSDLNLLLRDFDKSTNFLWIRINPDSFDSFVRLRRLCRTCSYSVDWHIDSSLTLLLINNPTYSCSD